MTNSTLNYTLIYYRPSYSHRCDGTWLEDFEMYTDLESYDLPSRWAQAIISANKKTESRSEAGIAILRNGRVMYSTIDETQAGADVWENSEERWKLDAQDDYSDEFEEKEKAAITAFNESWVEFRELQKQATELAEVTLKKKREAEQKEKAAEVEKTQAREQERRRTQYETLKKEFENGPTT